MMFARTRMVSSVCARGTSVSVIAVSCLVLVGWTFDIESLKSAEVDIRIQAAERLAHSCDRRAVLPLTRMLKDDKSPLARAAASQALGQLGDRETIDPLLEAIVDPDWQVRAQVGRALCSFQVHRASYDVLNTLVNPQNTPMPK